MNIYDSEQIRKKIEEEYNKNCEKINELNEKIWLTDKNIFENKAMISGVFAMIPWAISIPLMTKILKFAVIPLNLIAPLSIGISLSIGVAVEEILVRKLKWNQQFKNISKAKNQKEKIEELTKYKIEKEKLRSANKILNKINDDLSANESLINSLSTSYNITEKEVDERSKEEIASSIEKINNILQQKQQEVDIATTKSVLKEKFWIVRDTLNRFYDIAFGMMGGLMSMIFYDMPIVFINQLENMHIQTSILGVLAPAIVGGLACGGYCVKRRNDYASVFKKLNNELGDNAISEFRDYEEDKQFDKDLENVIKDTCAVKLKLESEKQKLNHAPETPSDLQMHSETVTVQMSYAKSETPLENMTSFMEESIFEEPSKQQGPVLKKTMNQQKQNK